MIDRSLRAKLFEDNKTKTLVDGMKDSIISALQNNSNTGANEEVLKLVVKREEDQNLQKSIDKIGQAIAMIYSVLSRPLILPKIFQVKGSVEVSKPIGVNNLDDLSPYFKDVTKAVNNLALAVQSVPQQKIEFPKIEFPKLENNNQEIVKAIQELEDNLVGGLNKSGNNSDMISLLKRIQQGIGDMVNKPTFVPPAVTKIDINPLRGQFQSTLVTVGTTPTPLPGNAAVRRRGIVIYNEDSSTTVRIGGAAVVASGSNGAKVGLAVLAQSYSPVMDAGPTMILYGIVSSGSANVTVLELENDYGTSSTSVGNI